jgi:hypothetical protein
MKGRIVRHPEKGAVIFRGGDAEVGAKRFAATRAECWVELGEGRWRTIRMDPALLSTLHGLLVDAWRRSTEHPPPAQDSVPGDEAGRSATEEGGENGRGA